MHPKPKLKIEQKQKITNSKELGKEGEKKKQRIKRKNIYRDLSI